MNKLSAVLATLAMLAATAVAQNQLALPCARDNVNLNYPGETVANCGASTTGRVAKYKQEGTIYCDWDTAAMQSLAGWIAALEPDQQYTVEFQICGATFDPDNPDRIIYVETFRSVSDWAEGDGSGGSGSADWEWTTNPAATNDYAQASNNGYGVPGDPQDQVPWVDPDTMADAAFWELPGNLNTEPFSGWYASILDPFTVVWNSVVLDEDLVADLMSHREVSYVRGIRCWSNEYGNEQGFLRGQWGMPGVCPRLVATAVEQLPVPGDTNDDGWVDGADYTNWADNYLSTPVPAWEDGGWTVGNFNADDTVDGADYTVWADNYNPPPPGGSVPEPAALSLLALSAGAALRRRR